MTGCYKRRISLLSFCLPDLDPICSPWVTTHQQKHWTLFTVLRLYKGLCALFSSKLLMQKFETFISSEWCLGVIGIVTVLHYHLTCQYHQQKMHEHAFGIQGHAVAVIQVLMDVLSKLRKQHVSQITCAYYVGTGVVPVNLSINNSDGLEWFYMNI